MNFKITFLLMFIAILFIACNKQKEKQIKELRYVRTMVVGDSLIYGKKKYFSGKARSSKEIKTSFKVSGNIEEIYVKVGDNVKKDQPLAKLDTKGYEIQADKAKATLSKASSAEQQGTSDYKRNKELYVKEVISQSELEASMTNFNTLKANRQSAQKQLDNAKLQLQYTTLKAPISGTISSLNVEVGENVAPANIIAIIVSKGKMEVSIGVPEAFINHISKGQKVKVNFEALGDDYFSGSVLEVGTSNLSGSTFPVTILLDKENKKILSGMSARVEFMLGKKNAQKIFVIPLHCVIQDTRGKHVFALVKKENKWIAKRINVKVGNLLDEGIEILSGLNNKDLLITAGMSKLVDGQEVKAPKNQ